MSPRSSELGTEGTDFTPPWQLHSHKLARSRRHHHVLPWGLEQNSPKVSEIQSICVEASPSSFSALHSKGFQKPRVVKLLELSEAPSRSSWEPGNENIILLLKLDQISHLESLLVKLTEQ